METKAKSENIINILCQKIANLEKQNAILSAQLIEMDNNNQAKGRDTK
jgi:hypothetical protein